MKDIDSPGAYITGEGMGKILFIYLFWPCHMACRNLVLQPAIAPTPLAVKHGVLVTRQPGESDV